MQNPGLKNAGACFVDLGLIDYQDAYRIQKQAVLQVAAGEEEKIFFCEHPCVLTLGRLADERYILASQNELSRRGINVVSIDRGGEVTLHAPGQLVVYPILDLKKHGKDLKHYLHDLEETAIEFLQGYGICSLRNPGKTGVWVGPKKIVSIGVGATVIGGVSIGDNVSIGAGAVVTRDIPANCTAVGVPAKPIPDPGIVQNGQKKQQELEFVLLTTDEFWR
jgi:lipoate-protein ligase B